MRQTIKISKSKRQKYEYNLLIQNLNNYKMELKRIEDRYSNDNSNIFFLNMSTYYKTKIYRIEKLLKK